MSDIDPPVGQEEDLKPGGALDRTMDIEVRRSLNAYWIEGYVMTDYEITWVGDAPHIVINFKPRNGEVAARRKFAASP